jgi:primosomal protein N''
MMKGNEMNINQIRTTLDELESNYDMAMKFSAYPLADHLLKQIDVLREELVRQIQTEDPYTTEADIHYFEWQNDGQPSEMQEWHDFDPDC